MLHQDLFDSLPKGYISEKDFSTLVDLYYADELFNVLDEQAYNEYKLVIDALCNKEYL
jgi:hypothetical protein